MTTTIGRILCSTSLALTLFLPTTQAQQPAAPQLETLSGFVANAGQWDDEVLFFARQGRVEATLLRDAIVFAAARDLDGEEPRPEPVVFRLPENGAATLHGKGLLPTQNHFLIGPLSEHVSHVPGFERVVFDDVAPGIDLLLRREATGFAYDVHLEPGAQLADFTLSIEGASTPRIDANGELLLDTSMGPLTQRISASWEVEPATSARRDIASRLRVLPTSDGSVQLGFEAPERDPARAFVLDPSVIFATFIGGPSSDWFPSMDVGPDGSTYLIARTGGGMPTTPNAPDDSVEGITDAWVGKLSPDGSTMVWATYLGGETDVEEVYGVHVDQDGTVVAIGNTWSADFPSTPGSLQEQIGSPGMADVFVTRLAADGSSLEWSTFYGGALQEGIETTALSPSGDVVVFGGAPNGMPPADPGSYDPQWDPDDAYIMCVTADGTARAFQSYFRYAFNDIAVNEDGELYLAGAWLEDWGSIGTPGAFQEHPAVPAGSQVDGVLVKMDSLCTQIEWATYLGASTSDSILYLALAPSGAIYVTGNAFAAGFPVTPGAFDTTPNSGSSNYVAKFLPNGSDLVWATFLDAGGPAYSVWDIDVDAAGNAVVTGSTNGSEFPTTPDAFQPDLAVSGASGDVTLTKLDAFGEGLEYATYFGAPGNDSLARIGFDATYQLRMGTYAWSRDSYVSPGAFDMTYGGGGDIHVSAWDLGLLPWTVLGGAMTGSDHVPNLAGTGKLTPGTTTRLSLRGAAPLVPAWFVIGLSAIDAPVKGGTLVPAFDALVRIQPDANGAYDLVFPWTGIPAGLDIYIQTWIKDPGGPVGWSASNALQLTSQ